MGKVYERIEDHQKEWIARQAMFFVGSAPLAGDGHVNVSPKGPIGSLAVLDDHTVAYLDVNGSGNETIAHLRENGRIVIMLCAFDGPPRILRLHGTGTVHRPGDPEFDALLERCRFDEPSLPEARRAVIVVDVARAADSCGYGVPLMSYAGERPHSRLSAEKRVRTRGPDAYREYEERHNLTSVDGLPAVSPLR